MRILRFRALRPAPLNRQELIRQSKAPTLRLKPCPGNGVFPDSHPQMDPREAVYTTTRFPTRVFWQGAFQPVANPAMDQVIVRRDSGFVAMKQVFVLQGDLVVCGHHDLPECGIQLELPVSDGTLARAPIFGFQGEESSETPARDKVRPVAQSLFENYFGEPRLNVWIPGPVLIHKDLVDPFKWLIDQGFVDVLFGSAALSTHDPEMDYFDTALGYHRPEFRDPYPKVDRGHSFHLWAANRTRLNGGVVGAGDAGLLRNGIFSAIHKHGISFIGAGSYRDDAPAVEIFTDMDLARLAHKAIINQLVEQDALGAMVVLGTQLHGIGTGNLTPQVPGHTFHVVDIDPNVDKKVRNRGTTHARGYPMDLELFLPALVQVLQDMMREESVIADGPRTDLYGRLGLQAVAQKYIDFHREWLETKHRAFRDAGLI